MVYGTTVDRPRNAAHTKIRLDIREREAVQRHNLSRSGNSKISCDHRSLPREIRLPTTVRGRSQTPSQGATASQAVLRWNTLRSADATARSKHRSRRQPERPRRASRAFTKPLRRVRLHLRSIKRAQDRTRTTRSRGLDTSPNSRACARPRARRGVRAVAPSHSRRERRRRLTPGDDCQGLLPISPDISARTGLATVQDAAGFGEAAGGRFPPATERRQPPGSWREFLKQSHSRLDSRGVGAPRRRNPSNPIAPPSKRPVATGSAFSWRFRRNACQVRGTAKHPIGWRAALPGARRFLPPSSDSIWAFVSPAARPQSPSPRPPDGPASGSFRPPRVARKAPRRPATPPPPDPVPKPKARAPPAVAPSPSPRICPPCLAPQSVRDAGSRQAFVRQTNNPAWLEGSGDGSPEPIFSNARFRC